MKKLLLITGDLATGKSTFAGQLSQRYDTNVFYKDTIKEVLADTIGFRDREENLKLSRATGELMLFLFEGSAKLGKDLILESNFRPVELEKLHRTAREYGYAVLTVLLRGDAQILHERYLDRSRGGNRHPVHLSTTFEVFEDFREYLLRSRETAVPGNVLPVDANDFSYQQDGALLRSIDEFFGKQITPDHLG